MVWYALVYGLVLVLGSVCTSGFWYEVGFVGGFEMTVSEW